MSAKPSLARRAAVSLSSICSCACLSCGCSTANIGTCVLSSSLQHRPGDDVSPGREGLRHHPDFSSPFQMVFCEGRNVMEAVILHQIMRPVRTIPTGVPRVLVRRGNGAQPLCTVAAGGDSTEESLLWADYQMLRRLV
jgi:hypothetical protein